MEEYVGEETIGVLPPAIPADQISAPENYIPAPLGNKGMVGVTNTTFLLNTNESTPVGENKVMKLHQGTYANSAIVVLEAAEGAVQNAVIARHWQDGSLPTPTDGLPMTHLSIFEIVGTENIRRFRIISADNKAHKVQVQYLM
nr:hypothetical protein [Pedobacter kyonggii]